MLRRAITYAAGLAVLLLSAAGTAHAAISFAAPEVEVKSVGGGIGLLAAGLLILQSRRRQKP